MRNFFKLLIPVFLIGLLFGCVSTPDQELKTPASETMQKPFIKRMSQPHEPQGNIAPSPHAKVHCPPEAYGQPKGNC